MKSRIIAISLCIMPFWFQTPVSFKSKRKPFERVYNASEIEYPSFQTSIERMEEELTKVKEEYKNEIMKSWMNYIKEKEEEDKVKKEQELKKQQENKDKGLKGNTKEVDFILSFYTNLPEENGGYTITCTGQPLKYGMVASNYYKLGTKVYLNGIGTFAVSDKGGNHFNNYNRLDVLIPRRSGESNSQYKRRVNGYGKPKVKGYVEIN